MEEIEVTNSLLGTCLGLFVTVITFIVKNKKNKLRNIKAKDLVTITNILIPLISKAEKYINYTGEEKKEYVLTKVIKYALENSLSYNEEEISKKIEELISLTKDVNVTQETTKIIKSNDVNWV